jgi:hypothetical protein
MDIRKLLLTPQAITAFALIAVLAFPCIVEAVSIGEVVSQSKLGKPLFVQVGLVAGSDEHIKDSCLSLTAPDPLEEDASGYLTNANLALKTEGKRQYVEISSRTPFNDAFARFRLQVKCPGMGNVIKTLTILPDMDAPGPQAQITAPSIPAEAENISVPPSSIAHDIAPAANPRDTLDTQPDVEKHLADKAVRPVHKRHPPSVRTASKKQSRSTSYRLELSGAPLDESRIGKASKEGRALLLARQKMLDADDQMVKFMAMQHQVKLLQDELAEVKLQLSQLGPINSQLAQLGAITSQLSQSGISSATTVSAVTASSTVTPAPSVATLATGTQGNSPKTIAVKQPVIQPNSSGLQNGLFAALWLVLVILALWVGLRYYPKIKSRIGIKSQHDTAKPYSQITPSQARSGKVPAVVAPDDSMLPHKNADLNFIRRDSVSK